MFFFTIIKSIIQETETGSSITPKDARVNNQQEGDIKSQSNCNKSLAGIISAALRSVFTGTGTFAGDHEIRWCIIISKSGNQLFTFDDAP
jgi:hypothetical protein